MFYVYLNIYRYLTLTPKVEYFLFLATNYSYISYNMVQ